MAILGAHQSIAGGHFKAVERAHAVGCDCVQVFTGSNRQWPILTSRTDSQSVRFPTKNNNQWRAKELTDDDVAQFQAKLEELGVKHPLAHDSYLINLASPDPVLWKKSVDSFVMEMLRADRLGIPYLVTHPGAHTTSSEEAGIAAVVRALDEVHRQTRGIITKCLLETTAGQGSCLGCRFEQLAAMIDGVQDPDRLGICVDTCHIFAAGYPISTEKDYKATLRALDSTVGIQLVRAVHVNDSQKPLGSRVDRHAHIGRGMIGKEGFRLLLNDRRFRKIPMYLETPKGNVEEQKSGKFDAMNLRTLRRLVDPPRTT
jgi:deoxyribonuclease IV